MLGAILCQYRLEASGPARGYVSAGTAWNKDWATKYGPDARKPKKKIKRAEIEKAVEAIAVADLPEEFNEARDIVDAYSVNELLREQDEAHYLLVIYTEYMIWLRDEEDIATLLLLM